MRRFNEHASKEHPGHGEHERRGRRGEFGPWGHPGRRGSGRRMRRGNVRAAILALLTERPMHGYEMISELEQRTGGIWRPSPGSVYPTLQLLEDEGMVTSLEQGGKRLFTITEAGSAEAANNPEPWQEMNEEAGESPLKARDSVGQLVMALKQVMAAGNPDQQARALGVIDDARRKLYGILAEN